MKQIQERNLNSNNKTPLHIAIESNSKSMHEGFKDESYKIRALFISKGADINAKDIIYQITINHF